MRRSLRIAILLGILAAPALAVTPWQAQELSEAIAAGTWQQSEKLCREMLPNAAAEPAEALAVKYNLGLSLLQQKKNDEAKSLFETVVKDSKDKALRAKASYNLGNTLFALEKLDEAKKAFEESLLLDSDDDDARYNIEVILRKQKQDEEKKNQQDQNKDNQDQNKDNKDQQNKDQQDKDDQDKQDQDKGEQGKNDQGKDQDGKDQEGKDGQPKDGKDQQGKDQENSKADQQDGKDSQGGQAQGGQEKADPQEAAAAAMSPAERKAAEEAQERARLLEFFRQQERDGRPAMRVRAQPPPPGGKTW